MADKVELKARLAFRKEALGRLRAAYLALVDGGVKNYSIEGRQLSRLDLDKLKAEIRGAEAEVDALEALLSGGRQRRAFAVVPRG